MLDAVHEMSREADCRGIVPFYARNTIVVIIVSASFGFTSGRCFCYYKYISRTSYVYRYVQVRCIQLIVSSSLSWLNVPVNVEVSHAIFCRSHADGVQRCPNLWVALLCPNLHLTLLGLTRRSVEHGSYSAEG